MSAGPSQGAPRTPATLEAAVETETALGGRTTAWSVVVARLWLDLSPVAGRESADQQLRPVRMEAATATARDDPRTAPGQRLTIAGGPPWRVLAVDRAQPAPGRMRLTLERTG